MCGRGRRRRGGSDSAVAVSSGRGFCATALAVVTLAAAAAVAFLESTSGGGVAYAGEGWLHECAKWDAEGGRFLVSTFFGAGVAEVRVGGGSEGGLVEERVVVADPEVAGRVALGLAVDAPRRRVLVVYADRPPRFGYAAVGAYELGSGRRIFLARLDGPGTSHPVIDGLSWPYECSCFVAVRSIRLVTDRWATSVPSPSRTVGNVIRTFHWRIGLGGMVIDYVHESMNSGHYKSTVVRSTVVFHFFSLTNT